MKYTKKTNGKNILMKFRIFHSVKKQKDKVKRKQEDTKTEIKIGSDIK